MKRQLAAWSPRCFHPHVDAEVRHEVWLSYLVGSDDHDTRVITDGHELVGFFNVVRQPLHRWVDDLVLGNDDLWPDAARLVATHVADPWVTCVCRADAAAYLCRCAFSTRTDSCSRVAKFWHDSAGARKTPSLPVVQPSKE